MKQNIFNTIEQLTQENATIIAQEWHYDGEYAFYDMENDQENYEEIMSSKLRGDRYFQVLDEEGRLTAFFCLEEADKPGQVEAGLGMAPSLTGHGLGIQLMHLIENYVQEKQNFETIVLSVASFNKRALKVYQRAGFAITGTEQAQSNGGSYEFILMAKQFANN